MLLKKIWVLVFSFMYLVSIDPMDRSIDLNLKLFLYNCCKKLSSLKNVGPIRQLEYDSHLNYSKKATFLSKECTNHNLHPDNVPMLIVGNKLDGNNEDVIGVPTNIAQR